jgi:hypothetical protein
MPLIRFAFATFVVLVPTLAFADGNPACDTAQEISFAEAQSRAVLSPPPVFPPLAKAAGIGGIVKIAVCVSDKGEVISTRLVSGHPLLVGAAMNNVKAWRFGSGQGPFRTVMEVNFARAGTPAEQAREDAINQAYFDTDQQCRNDLQHSSADAAVRDCGKALQLVDKLPQHRSNERRTANEMMGHAFFRHKDFQNALKYYATELAIAQKTLHADEAELAYAYHDVARANHVLGRPVQAAEAYEKAEEILPLAAQHIHIDGLDRKYLATLKQVREEHLILLQQTGDVAGAAALRKTIDSTQN